ncbi:MAG: hypothetical protein DI551_07500 [Micavibrio aeruginosavorus]|uniref:Uncharacterized protein n=1 Tax=Micavibrio aeruginosavorus TaxID=349221 RepID=A0A2W5N3K4_9BACT|nr:MAG: hypothetical protein DI551_07500 [Micavibrio aeruginosavorus]
MKTGWQKTSLTWGKRLAIVVLILLAMSYGVLILAQRSKESLRLGLQDYLMEATGHQAEITHLAEANIVPQSVFKIQGILIRDKKDDKKVYASVKSAYISLPFFNMMFGRGVYSGFEMKGMEFASGYALPKKLTIDYAGVSDPSPETATPVFMIEGLYNDYPLLMTMQMSRKQGKGGYLYRFNEITPMTYKLGPLEGDADYVRSFTTLSLEKGRFVLDGHEVEFTATDLDTRPLKARLKGRIDGLDFNGTLIKTNESMVLTIAPANHDENTLKTLKNVISIFQKTLGLTPDDKTMTITINENGAKAEE